MNQPRRRLPETHGAAQRRTARKDHKVTQTAAAVTTTASQMDRALEAGAGIVRLAPTWVPRSFCTPGRRIRLHPDDYFPFEEGRGGIDERWLSSACGPTTDRAPAPSKA
jgi:hypothetical protein